MEREPASMGDLLTKGRTTVCQGGQHVLVVVDRKNENGEPCNPIIELWGEDDDNWFYKTSFDLYWVNKLADGLVHIARTERHYWPVLTGSTPSGGAADG